MLKIPSSTPKDGTLELWVREVIDECMASVEERAMVYTRASQYYYTGTYSAQAAIYNKTKPFIDKLSGFLMQPTDVRYQIVYDSGEPDSVLERSQLVSEKLTADYRQTDSDITFSEALTWAMINGCYLLKHYPHEDGFKVAPVHPQNFGVLGETILDLDEQEAFVHVTYPTISRLRTILQDHPEAPGNSSAHIRGYGQRSRTKNSRPIFTRWSLAASTPWANRAECPTRRPAALSTCSRSRHPGNRSGAFQPDRQILRAVDQGPRSRW